MGLPQSYPWTPYRSYPNACIRRCIRSATRPGCIPGARGASENTKPGNEGTMRSNPGALQNPAVRKGRGRFELQERAGPTVQQEQWKPLTCSRASIPDEVNTFPFDGEPVMRQLVEAFLRLEPIVIVAPILRQVAENSVIRACGPPGLVGKLWPDRRVDAAMQVCDLVFGKGDAKGFRLAVRCARLLSESGRAQLRQHRKATCRSTQTQQVSSSHDRLLLGERQRRRSQKGTQNCTVDFAKSSLRC